MKMFDNIQGLCPWCKCDDSSLVIETRDWRHSIPGSFRLYQCKNCGLLRQMPLPDWAELATYYPIEYVSFSDNSEGNNWLKKIINSSGYREKINLIELFSKEGNLFDVGCGTGEFLKYLQGIGNWNLYGLEPIENAARVAETKLGFPIIKTMFESSTQFNNEFFDVITMWEVIEHLFDPVAAIEKAANLLKPGGVLVMSTPNLNAIDRLVFGEYWAGYDLPRHLHLFPGSVLENICRNFQLGLIQNICIGGSYTTLLIDLQSWNISRKSKLINSILTNKGCNLPLRLATYIPRLVIKFLLLGTSVTLVFRKNA